MKRSQETGGHQKVSKQVTFRPAAMRPRRALLGALLVALCARAAAVSLYRDSKVVELDINNFWRYTGNVSAGEVSVVEVRAVAFHANLGDGTGSAARTLLACNISATQRALLCQTSRVLTTHSTSAPYGLGMPRACSPRTAPARAQAYVSWCPHCQRMAPAYRLFAAEAEPWAPAIHVTAVDCVAHDLLCRDLGVWGYPTLFLFGDLRPTVEAVDNVFARIKHEGAFAEGYPAHAIHELWQWTLSWATPRTERVQTPQALTVAKERALAAGVPLVLFVRSEWDPSSELWAAPPPPLAPVPAVPPPMPFAPPSAGPRAAGPTLPPSPPEDGLAPLFGDWVDAVPSEDDPCAQLTQPACLEPEHGCEPVIDCWNAHWPSSCHW